MSRLIISLFISSMVLGVGLAGFSQATASDQKKHEHKHEHGHEHGQDSKGKKKHHHAHVHGFGEVKIALDKTEGVITFKTAADAILGFERVAKSEKDLATLKTAVDYFKSYGLAMFQLPASANCTLNAEKVEQVVTGKNHSDFVAEYRFKCEADLTKSEVNLDFSKYPKLKKVDVEVLNGTNAIQAVYNRKPLKIVIP